MVFNLINIRPPSKADDWKVKRGNLLILHLRFPQISVLSLFSPPECSRATPAGKYEHNSLFSARRRADDVLYDISLVSEVDLVCQQSQLGKQVQDSFHNWEQTGEKVRKTND